MSKFANERVRDLTPYTPGEQPKDAQYIKLNTNESPFPPSERAMRAIDRRQLEDLRLYSDPEATELTQAIARALDVPPQCVLATNGSDETLAFCFMAFCDARGVRFADITYGFYPVYAQLFGIPATLCPVDESLRIDPQAYCNVGQTVLIANPNAQTGIALTRDQLRRVIETNPDQVVVVDEAYVDFGAQSCVPLVAEYPNLVVVQTLSKSRSLAGGRIGFAIAQPHLIEDLKTVKYSFNPYNLDRLNIVLAAQAMADRETFRTRCEQIASVRETFKRALDGLGMQYTPSQANFVLAKHPKIDGATLQRKLKEQGILVRHFTDPKIADYVRITIGTQEQMQSLTQAIARITEAI